MFPLLRRRCQERGIAWSEVDLRWGVTTEQAAPTNWASGCWPTSST
ncbi:MAG: hypothetical protein R2742_05180 [Micropruina glycogenica]